MTSMTAFSAFIPVRRAYRIHKLSPESWWVYCHELGINGDLMPASRIVFFGNHRIQVEEWMLSREQEEGHAFVFGDL